MIDDGQWHAYAIEFDPFVNASGSPWQISSNTIRVMLEDFSGSGGVTGDAFFDNVQLSIKR